MGHGECPHGSCTRVGSDIIGLNAPGFNIIVLDTLEAANALGLLDKRSEICSSGHVFHVPLRRMCTHWVSN